MYDRTVAGVNDLGLEVEDVVEREHVVVQVLEHGRALAEDAVAAEDRVLFLINRGECYYNQFQLFLLILDLQMAFFFKKQCYNATFAKI
jgi:hypothetical protein